MSVHLSEPGSNLSSVVHRILLEWLRFSSGLFHRAPSSPVQPSWPFLICSLIYVNSLHLCRETLLLAPPGTSSAPCKSPPCLPSLQQGDAFHHPERSFHSWKHLPRGMDVEGRAGLQEPCHFPLGQQCCSPLAWVSLATTGEPWWLVAPFAFPCVPKHFAKCNGCKI